MENTSFFFYTLSVGGRTMYNYISVLKYLLVYAYGCVSPRLSFGLRTSFSMFEFVYLVFSTLYFICWILLPDLFYDLEWLTFEVQYIYLLAVESFMSFPSTSNLLISLLLLLLPPLLPLRFCRLRFWWNFEFTYLIDTQWLEMRYKIDCFFEFSSIKINKNCVLRFHSQSITTNSQSALSPNPFPIIYQISSHSISRFTGNRNQ